MRGGTITNVTKVVCAVQAGRRQKAGLRTPSELIWGPSLFRYSQGRGEGHGHCATLMRESGVGLKAVREAVPSCYLDLNDGRDLPVLEVCVGEYLSGLPKYRILSVAGRERQLDSPEVLRRDSGKGQIKPMHMKGK